MKTIRVFVSSPGDVQAERIIADRLIRSIAEELGIPVSVQYSNLLRNAQGPQSANNSAEQEPSELILSPYFWEYQRFSPELGYQDQMPNSTLSFAFCGHASERNCMLDFGCRTGASLSPGRTWLAAVTIEV